jgi:hypothetical protein
MKNLSIQPLWHQIIIEDSQALPGTSVHNLIKTILKAVDLQYIITANLEGAGTYYLEEQLKGHTGKINEFLNVVTSVKQFDWGDFYLFRKPPTETNNYNTKEYEKVIPQTDVTIRAVDDTYLYVYTQDPLVIKHIKDFFEIESDKVATIYDLDFPD